MKLLLLILISIFPFFTTHAHKIFILQSVNNASLDNAVLGIKDYLNSQKITNVQVQSALGQASFAKNVAQNLIDIKPDIVVAVGTLGTQTLGEFSSSGIRMVFDSVQDPISTAAVKFHTGTFCNILVKDQLSYFKTIVPKLYRVGILYDKSDIKYLKKIDEACKEIGLDLIKNAATTIDEMKEAINIFKERKCDAIFIYNNSLDASVINLVITKASEYKIMILSNNLEDVASGALAAMGCEEYVLGKKTGEIICNILNGDDDTKVYSAMNIIKSINMRVAKALNIPIDPISLKKIQQVVN